MTLAKSARGVYGPPMPPVTKRDRLDEAMDGQLEAWVRARRKAFRSWTQIAAEIYAEHGVDVTGVTLATWFPESKIGEAS